MFPIRVGSATLLNVVLSGLGDPSRDEPGHVGIEAGDETDELHVDIENGPSVELLPNQGYLVPKGVVHRTRALERTAMLMIEGATVTATGD